MQWKDFDFSKIFTRCSLPVLLDHMKATAICEVGVREGGFFKTLLSGGDIKRAYAVDLWDDFVTASQNDMGHTREHMGKIYKHFCDKYKDDDRVVVIKKPSNEAYKEIPDGMLDMVYIDADHTYDAVRQDLENYWPKLIDGGILGGHDYENILFRGVEFAAKRAVDEFVKERGLFIHVTREPRFKSYVIIKK